MQARELNFDPQNLRYTGIIGTGGIGSGKFFKLNHNHTLGREESRSGHFLDVNDYCKQHIILHYIKVLLGSSFSVIPIGKLGDDDIGSTLYNEMLETGFDMKYIEKVSNASTLFSFCFYYPDGSGGNMTTDDSASGRVDPAFIDKVSNEIKRLGKKGIILAAPEVPLDARHRLLVLGKQNDLFCSASFTSEEIAITLEKGIIKQVDLLAINIDEAFLLTGNSCNNTKPENIIQSAINKLKSYNQNIMVSITAGAKGSWCWDGHSTNYFPTIKTDAKGTAGAGDAFLSGLLTGLAIGLDLFDSQQLATLLAGLSVTSQHTIHKGADRKSLNDFMVTSGITISDKITKLMED